MTERVTFPPIRGAQSTPNLRHAVNTDATARSNVLLRGPVAVRDIKRSTSLTHRTDSQRNIPKAASFGNDSHYKVFAAWFCLIRIFHSPHVDLLVFCNEASVLTCEKSC